MELKHLPKENTHLYFAHKIIEDTERQDWRELVRANLGAYYLGSVMPDTFYYSGRETIRAISEIIHGHAGQQTNSIIFELLDEAKARTNLADLVFVLGYLTHVALDVVFHPVIYYWSGNYYDPNEKKRFDAMYLHRHLETFLDRKVNEDFFFHNLIKLKVIKQLSFPVVFRRDFGIKNSETTLLIRRKNLISFLQESRLAYYFFKLFYRLGVYKVEFLLGLSYISLEVDKRILPDVIDYRDIISGEPRRAAITELFDRADAMASEMFEAAFAYYHGTIDRTQAEKFIRGESLNTGRLHVGVQEIKYTYNSIGNHAHHLSKI